MVTSYEVLSENKCRLAQNSLPKSDNQKNLHFQYYRSGLWILIRIHYPSRIRILHLDSFSGLYELRI